MGGRRGSPAAPPAGVRGPGTMPAFLSGHLSQGLHAVSQHCQQATSTAADLDKKLQHVRTTFKRWKPVGPRPPPGAEAPGPRGTGAPRTGPSGSAAPRRVSVEEPAVTEALAGHNVNSLEDRAFDVLVDGDTDGPVVDTTPERVPEPSFEELFLRGTWENSAESPEAQVQRETTPRFRGRRLPFGPMEVGLGADIGGQNCGTPKSLGAVLPQGTSTPRMVSTANLLAKCNPDRPSAPHPQSAAIPSQPPKHVSPGCPCGRGSVGVGVASLKGQKPGTAAPGDEPPTVDGWGQPMTS